MKILCELGILFFLLFVNACSFFEKKSHQSVYDFFSEKNKKKTFIYTDASGSFDYIRETKQLKNMIVSRNRMFSKVERKRRSFLSSRNKNNSLLVEKSILLSKLGVIKSKGRNKLVLRPEKSEFLVWLEGKKYQNTMTIIPQKKAMRVEFTSLVSTHESESRKESYIETFPPSTHICFFNQLPECLKSNMLLKQMINKRREKTSIFILWDQYPFSQEMYLNVGSKLFSKASVKYEGTFKKNHRIVVEVEGQDIVYFFDNNLNFKKLAWIVQGTTLISPDELEVVDH